MIQSDSNDVLIMYWMNDRSDTDELLFCVVGSRYAFFSVHLEMPI